MRNCDIETRSFLLHQIKKERTNEMSKLFMYGSELQELEQLMMLVPNFYQGEAG